MATIYLVCTDDVDDRSVLAAFTTRAVAEAWLARYVPPDCAGCSRPVIAAFEADPAPYPGQGYWRLTRYWYWRRAGLTRDYEVWHENPDNAPMPAPELLLDDTTRPSVHVYSRTLAEARGLLEALLATPDGQAFVAAAEAHVRQ